jgi:hypothetical protein
MQESMGPRDFGIYSQEELDNHANQCNPNNDAYWSSHGQLEDEEDFGIYSQEELDNHANQCNPNNDAYGSSRGQLEDEDEDDD